MDRASHRRPRGRNRGAGRSGAPAGTPELVESVGSAVAPAEVGPPEELSPLEHDGLVPIAMLTAAWAIAAVVLFVLRADLANTDQTWWIWTCVAGFGLGLLGYTFSRRRRDALRARSSA